MLQICRSCVVWSFGTTVEPRMNVFDCRRQIKGIRCRRCCNQFASTVIRCGGVGHFSSFSHPVSRPLMKHIGIVSQTHPFNGPLSGTTRMGRCQKGKTNLDFTGARDSEWQWHQLGHMQVCTSLQTDNHASAPPLSFLQAGCPSCRPTNSVKALKAESVSVKGKNVV